jgi:glycosyltransferase involved in cell wall biosynthesis
MRSSSHAYVQYYITYNCFQGRVSPIEAGLFTHREAQESAASRFDQVARDLDVRVAMSSATAQLLRDIEGKMTRIISPGVDINHFKPKLRIGVVGRTYATGRKGEDLVAAVQDIPGIEWCFTGEGWPGVSKFVPDDELPAFYRSLDYVLVPARNEGGPMCVLEALACGVEVIGPRVGWVSDFPHIEFELGNAESLRKVLIGLLEKRLALRRSVEALTWDAWAEEHDRLFRSLAPKEVFSQYNVNRADSLRAAIVVHGKESGTSLGGPSVRGPLTARVLSMNGIAADFHSGLSFGAENYDLVHAMNVWEPGDCMKVLDQAALAETATVLSPIYLDLSEHTAYSRQIPDILSRTLSPEIVLPAFDAVRRQLEANRAKSPLATEIYPGYYQAVHDIVSRANHVIYLSEDEKAKLERIGVSHPSTSIIRNCVTSNSFRDGSPEVFRAAYGLKDYILVTGRIEPRKNQATLAYALRDAPYPIVILGHVGNENYMKILKSVAGPNLHIIPRLEPGSEMLASAFAGARVFCLPSWSEGAPLAAIEAASAGCTMVLSNRSSEREYFGDLAYYCDPADPAGIREIVDTAYKQGRSEARSAKLKELVDAEFSLQKYADSTAIAYKTAVEGHRGNIKENSSEGRLFIDLTTLAHRDGPPSGIARTEDRLAVELAAQFPGKVGYIVWNSRFEKFIPVPLEALEAGHIRMFHGAGVASQISSPENGLCFSELDFKPGDRVVIFGGAWIRNPRYTRDLKILRNALGVPLITTIYDVIQWKFCDLFPEGIGNEFATNCSEIIKISDRILTCSECSRKDILEFAQVQGLPVPPVHVFRLGDETRSIDPDAEIQIDRISGLSTDKPFVLYVSALDARKNHRVLIDVWSRLIEKYGAKAPVLVFVGSKGWGSEPIVAAATKPKLTPFIHIMHGINDLTLDWLYKNCRFTVYPSLYEGWGLPIAESLNHGKFCIAANTGSIPEIAPEFVELLDPADFKGWYEAIEKFILHPDLVVQKEARIAGYSPVSWASTAGALAEKLFKVRSHGTRPVLTLGQPLKISSDSIFSQLSLGGFSSAEKNGSWTNGAAAMLGFQSSIVNGPSLLAIRATPFVGSDDVPRIVRIEISSPKSGASASHGITMHGGTQWIFVPLDQIISGEGTFVDVRINILNPAVPAMIKGATSTDQRQLGLKLHQIGVSSYYRLQVDHPVEFVDSRPAEVFLFACEDSTGSGNFASFRLISEVNMSVDVMLGERKVRQIDLLAGFACDVPVMVTGITRDITPTMPLRIVSQNVGSFRVSRAVLSNALPQKMMRRQKAPPQLTDAGNWFGKPIMLEVGDTISVAQRHDIRGAIDGDWLIGNEDHLWSGGSPSRLFVALGDNCQTGRRRLRMGLAGFIGAADEDGLVGVTVTLAGSDIAVRIPANGSITNVFLPINGSSSPLISIVLQADRAISPAEIGLSADQRRLSFMLSTIGLEDFAFQDMRLGEILFADKVNHLALSGSWYEAEVGGIWSSGFESSIRLSGAVSGARVLTVGYQIFVGLLADVNSSCGICVRINGIQIGYIDQKDPAPSIWQTEIPFEVGAEIVVSFSGPNGISPKEKGLSADTRPLSFQIQSIRLD